MLCNNKMSFRVKPTHAFIKPAKEEVPTYSSNGNKKAPPTTPTTNTISSVKSSSSKGMAIRSTFGGMADCY